ncbi:hypothetical protein I7I51_04845 [Histoplasma capsulatum]|uniref:Uncharacterized protein n=1 Tax=Ajellomyces capsulatus TaxID=5037 RepID=A0A8A1M1U9_AJECA|nr:hypothetical protein I7I51_04845 [Histoplasma capsulatum]
MRFSEALVRAPSSTLQLNSETGQKSMEIMQSRTSYDVKKRGNGKSGRSSLKPPLESLESLLPSGFEKKRGMSDPSSMAKYGVRSATLNTPMDAPAGRGPRSKETNRGKKVGGAVEMPA